MNQRRTLIVLAVAAALGGGFAAVWVWQSTGLSGAERALKQAAPSEYAEYKQSLKALNEARKAYISTGEAIWTAENDEREAFVDAQFAVWWNYRDAWNEYSSDRIELEKAAPAKWAIFEAELITAIKKSAPEEWAGVNKAIEAEDETRAAMYETTSITVYKAFGSKLDKAAENIAAARALLKQAAPAEYAAWAYAVLSFWELYRVDAKVWASTG